MINTKRRKILKCSSVTSLMAMVEGAGLLSPDTVCAAEQNPISFADRNPNLTYSFAMKGQRVLIPSRDIILDVPDVAENGSVVPVEVFSKIKGTVRIFVVCEPSDWPVIADFKLMNGAESYISTRIKAGIGCETVTVRAIVHANGIAYSALKEVYLARSHCNGDGG